MLTVRKHDGFPATGLRLREAAEGHQHGQEQAIAAWRRTVNDAKLAEILYSIGHEVFAEY